MSRRFALAALLSVLAATLASVALAASTGPSATPFPVTVTAGNGKVTISKRPARIVSLSPTATETLFAIGAGAQVVAVDDQSDFPKAAPRTTLSGYTPNVEAIAALRPDLVVISFDPKGLSEALGRLGIPVRLPQRGGEPAGCVPADPAAGEADGTRARRRTAS